MAVKAIVIAMIATAGVARAESNDGYCDYVQGVASAESALAFAPELYVNAGYLEQIEPTLPPGDAAAPRVIGGVRYRLTGIREAIAMRARARAECRRHEALTRAQHGAERRALEARAAILDGALREAEQILQRDTEQLAAGQLTAREANATRLRVDELSALAAQTREQLAAAPADGAIAGALAEFQRADRAVEDADATLRRTAAFDVSVRFGVDADYQRVRSGYFAVASVSLNLGVFAQAGGNARARAGRARYALETAGAPELRATAQLARARASEVALLEADLQRQLEQLGKLAGEDARRYRQVVWFDWIKVKAEHAYLAARAAGADEVLR